MPAPPLQAWLGEFDIVALASDEFNVTNASTSQDIVISSGRTYISGYLPGGLGGLVEDMESRIQASHASLSTATVTWSPTTGLVTMTFATTTSVTWTYTALRDLLGFNSDLSGGTVYVAPRAARYTWLPSQPLAHTPMTAARMLAPKTTGMVYVGRTGMLSGVAGPSIYSANLRYRLLPHVDVAYQSTDDTWSTRYPFEAFYEDIVANVRPVRLYHDRSDVTSSDEHQLVRVTGADRIDRGVRRRDDRTDVLWDVDIEIARDVA